MTFTKFFTLSALFLLALGLKPDAANAAEIRGIAGKCLDLEQNQAYDGATIQIWQCNNTPAQSWRLNPQTGEIRGRAGKCLDVENANTEDGTRVQLFECNGTNAQKWRYHQGEIRGLAGKCLDVENANTNDGTRVQLMQCNGTNAQSWIILKLAPAWIVSRT